MSERVFVLFWILSLLLVRDLSTTDKSVLQVTRLNDVPSTDLYWPVLHLLLSLLFPKHSLMVLIEHYPLPPGPTRLVALLV